MPNENAVQVSLSSTPPRTCGPDQDSGTAFVLDQRHDTESETPVMIRSALHAREAIAKTPSDEAPPRPSDTGEKLIDERQGETRAVRDA